MPLVRSTIPNLIGGVSQQPAPMRLETAVESAENVYMSLVSGLQKRPPLEHIGKLDGPTIPDEAAVHLVKREEDYKYAVVGLNGDLEVYDLADGTRKTVTFSGGAATYLNSPNAVRDYRFATVGDTTFILNRQKTVSASNVAEDGSRLDPYDRVSVFIKRAVASTAYAVYVDGVLEATFTTSDNTTAGTALEGTAKIAEELATDAAANGNTGTGSVGPVFYMDVPEGAEVVVTDQFGGDAMRVILDHVNDFSELPPQEQVGRLVKVIGDPDEEGDDYWVEFDGQAWVETLGWEAGRELDATTMPYKLVDNRDGTLDIGPVTWGQRTVGDSDSNADPTFVGTKINGLFLHKGRLGLVADENLIMSETSVLENFFRVTVAQLLDTDRIDVASNTGQVNLLQHGVGFSKRLIVTSEKQQFEVESNGPLSPSSVSLEPVSAFESSTRVPPVDAGNGALFFYDGAQYSRVRELYVSSDGETLDSADLTIQVPRYIPRDIMAAAANSTENLLAIISGSDRDALYVYKWYFDGNERIQSAWSRWTFASGIRVSGCSFIDQELILVLSVDGVGHLASMRIEEAVFDTTTHDLLVDLRVIRDDCTVSYNAGTDKTTVTLPYSIGGTVEFWKTADPYGAQLTATKVSDDTYTLDGDQTATSWSAGLSYEMAVELSEFFVRDTSDGTASPIQDGRLQLKYGSVVYQDSVYFEIDVAVNKRGTKTYTFSGNSDQTLGEIDVETGEFRFPIFSKSNGVTITLKNDKPFPVSFGPFEWTAMFNPKARGI